CRTQTASQSEFMCVSQEKSHYCSQSLTNTQPYAYKTYTQYLTPPLSLYTHTHTHTHTHTNTLYPTCHVIQHNTLKVCAHPPPPPPPPPPPARTPVSA